MEIILTQAERIAIGETWTKQNLGGLVAFELDDRVERIPPLTPDDEKAKVSLMREWQLHKAIRQKNEAIEILRRLSFALGEPYREGRTVEINSEAYERIQKLINEP